MKAKRTKKGIDCQGDVCMSKSDRECVLDHPSNKGKGSLLDASDPGHASVKDPNWDKYPCVMAVDGNGYPTSFSSSLLKEQVVLRLGGYNAQEPPKTRRASSYQWFEPLLVEGVHYLRTDLDGLADFLQKMPQPAAMQRVAARGRLTGQALFSRRSQLCYAALAVDAYAKRQKTAIAEAKTLAKHWKFLDDVELVVQNNIMPKWCDWKFQRDTAMPFGRPVHSTC